MKGVLWDFIYEHLREREMLRMRQSQREETYRNLEDGDRQQIGEKEQEEKWPEKRVESGG